MEGARGERAFMKLNAIKSDFDIISHLRGFLTVDAFELFCNLRKLSCIPDKPILEIGVFCGRSLASLACAFENVKIVGVDPFYNSFRDSPAFEDEAEHLASVSNQMSPEERIKVFWGIIDLLDKKNKTNLKILIKLERVTQDEFFRKRVNVNKYQLIHIDGEHTYNAVKNCLDMLDKILHLEGWLVIDDLFNLGYPDISEAVHLHKNFRKTFWPIFYGFNKGVFIYKPYSISQISSIKENLYEMYTDDIYGVKRAHDMALAVYRKRNLGSQHKNIINKNNFENILFTRCKKLLKRFNFL